MIEAVWGLLITIDGVIYNLICYLFEIFTYLSKVNIFGMDTYKDLVSRVYIILGLVMLFVLTYTLLKAIINPDDFAKGDTSFAKLIQNVIVSLAILTLLPTVFTVAFNIQNALINYDTIPKLILGTSSDTVDVADVDSDTENSQVKGGRAIAFYMFKAFFSPNMEHHDVKNNWCAHLNADECRTKLKSNSWWWGSNGEHSLAETDNAVLNNGATFTAYNDYSNLLDDHAISYYFPISTIAGIFVLWVMLNFCFDMALRVVKLAFYQIIAPIPVVCRVIPGGKMKDVFSKWVKQVVSLFAEVFVRIGAMSLGVYLIGLLIGKWNDGLPGIEALNSFGQKGIVLALLIMSIVIMIKQLPKLIGDLVGIDTGGMKLGIMDRLAQGGGLLAGAALGGGLLTGGRNAVSAIGKIKEAKGFKNKFREVRRGLGSFGAGVASGAFRGVKGGHSSKNFGDVKKAIVGAADAADVAKLKRDNRRDKAEAEWQSELNSRKDELENEAQAFEKNKNTYNDNISQLNNKKNSYLDKNKAAEEDYKTKIKNLNYAAMSGANGYMDPQAMKQAEAKYKKERDAAIAANNAKIAEIDKEIGVNQQSLDRVNSELAVKYEQIANVEKAISSGSLERSWEVSKKKFSYIATSKVHQVQDLFGFNNLKTIDKQINVAGDFSKKFDEYKSLSDAVVEKAGGAIESSYQLVQKLADKRFTKSLSEMRTRVDSIKFEDVKGTVAKDFLGQDFGTINTSEEFAAYKKRISDQLGFATKKVKDKVADYASRPTGTDELNAIFVGELDSMGKQLKLSAGDAAKLRSSYSSYENFASAYSQQAAEITAFREAAKAAGVDPNKLQSVQGFDNADSFNNALKEINNYLRNKKETIERERRDEKEGK